MRLIVVVPYRDRAAHLTRFVPHLSHVLGQQKIEYRLVVVEQSPEKLFNRGLLCNIGFYEFKEQCDYVCFHDVDLLPRTVDYSYSAHPTHLCGQQRAYVGTLYEEYFDENCFGGITISPARSFIAVNGFSNNYWGWGCEDEDLRIRYDAKKIARRQRSGRVIIQPHPRMPYNDRMAKSPGYEANYERFMAFTGASDQEATMRQDGLNQVTNYYTVTARIEKSGYTFLQCQI